MRLTAEREETIRKYSKQLYAGPIPGELLAEIKALREERDTAVKALQCYAFEKWQYVPGQGWIGPGPIPAHEVLAAIDAAQETNE